MIRKSFHISNAQASFPCEDIKMQIRTETCVLEEPNKYVKNHYFVYSTWIISTISTIRLAMLCCFWFMLLEALTRINNSETRSKKKKRSYKYINELELSGSSKPCLVSFREFMAKVVVQYRKKLLFNTSGFQTCAYL